MIHHIRNFMILDLTIARYLKKESNILFMRKHLIHILIEKMVNSLKHSLNSILILCKNLVFKYWDILQRDWDFLLISLIIGLQRIPYLLLDLLSTCLAKLKLSNKINYQKKKCNSLLLFIQIQVLLLS